MRSAMVAAALAACLCWTGPATAVAADLEKLIKRNNTTRALKLKRADTVKPLVATTPQKVVTERDPAAAGPLVPARIWLHVRRNDQMSFKTSFEQVIGDTIPVNQRPREVEWMPVQEVQVGPSRSQIRFFKDYDRDTATVLKRAFARQGAEVELRDMTKEYASAGWLDAGHIEVWLSPDAAMP